MMIFPTKNAARESGLKTFSEWMQRDYKTNRAPLIPVRDAKPLVVKNEEFYSIYQCEDLYSVTAAKQVGLKLRKDAEHMLIAHRLINGIAIKYPMYRESDFEPTRKVRCIPTKEIDLLSAIYTVNKSTKRYRDAARNAYHNHLWGFASYHKEKKEYLYLLKDKGIAEAYRIDRLSLSHRHGLMAVYTGDGYCFHSWIMPKGISCEPGEPGQVFIESSPKSRSEARLKDAIYTLEKLPDFADSFDRLSNDSKGPSRDNSYFPHFEQLYQLDED